MLLLLLILSCRTPAPLPVAPPPLAASPDGVPLRFAPAESPGPGTRLVATAERGGTPVRIAWHPLIDTGAKIGGVVYGQVQPRPGESPADAPLCASPDGQTLMEVGGRVVLTSQHECGVGVLSRLELQPEADGGWLPTALSVVPFENGVPGFQPCAAVISPWGTHLGSEEYEPDAALIGPDGRMLASERQPDGTVRVVDDYDYNDLVDHQRGIGPPLSPYAVGWVLEVDPTRPTASRRFALGRASHELALAVDARTVYLSDDAQGGGLYLFVADTAGDLRRGALYAARWDQRVDEFELRWVLLGQADEAVVAAAIDAGMTFGSLYDRQLPVQGGTCAEGFRLVRAHTGHECLALRPGQDVLASRLETRRTAAWMGATTEVTKAEGMAWDPARQEVYLAVTRISDSMLAEPGLRANPSGSRDDIALESNRCGVVYRGSTSGGVRDTAGRPIDSSRVLTGLRVALSGRPEGEGCAADQVSNPDNLSFIPGEGVLLVGEDTSHQPEAALWSWHSDGSGPPQRLLLAAVGAEVTGLSWAPAIAGADWITVAIQHPDHDAGQVGLIGPFLR